LVQEGGVCFGPYYILLQLSSESEHRFPLKNLFLDETSWTDGFPLLPTKFFSADVISKHV
jgi:hypothetical protein